MSAGKPLRSLFISHGAPNVLIKDTAAHRFLRTLGSVIPRPKAIVSVSAHFEADRPTVVADPAPATIYDFGGFEPEMYQQRYPAPGHPELAHEVAETLASAGLLPDILPKRGYDHGVWVPLKLAYPQADIPIVQVSINPLKDADYHFRLGQVLAPLLSDDVIMIATGAITHNLSALFGQGQGQGLRPVDDQPELWSEAFADWVADHVVAGATRDLLQWDRLAPHALKNHPEAEHLMPLFAALGAAGSGAVQHLHKSTEYGVIRMDTFGFEAAA